MDALLDDTSIVNSKSRGHLDDTGVSAVVTVLTAAQKPSHSPEVAGVWEM